MLWLGHLILHKHYMQVNKLDFKTAYWDCSPGSSRSFTIGEKGISVDENEQLGAGQKIGLTVRNKFKRGGTIFVSLSLNFPNNIPVLSGTTLSCGSIHQEEQNIIEEFQIAALPEGHNLDWYEKSINETGSSIWIFPKEVILGYKFSVYFHSIHGSRIRLKIQATSDIKFDPIRS